MAGPGHEEVRRALEHRAAARAGRRRRSARASPPARRRSRARSGSARSRSPGSTARSRSPAPARAPPAPPGSPAPSRRRRTSTPSTGPSARSRIMNSWKPNHSPRARMWVRTAASLRRQHARRDAERPRQLRERLGQPRALAEPPRPLQADREVAVAEVEPDVLAERAQGVHHHEGVVAQAPAALVDAIGQPVEDEVGVGRDVAAVDLDVVAGVGDHDEIARRPRRAVRAPAWRRPYRPPAEPRGSSRRRSISSATP